jgi:hypothetical protein
MLQVDAQLGVLLEVIALRDGQPFHTITTIEIAFDQPIPAERFHFQPPAGEEIRPTQGGPRPQHLTLLEAEQRAPFTVLIPDRIPADWNGHCVFTEPSERPPRPAQVSLSYSSDDGHESVSLTQSAPADRLDHYDHLTRGERWQEVTRNGTVIGVTKPEQGPQAQAHRSSSPTR